MTSLTSFLTSDTIQLMEDMHYSRWDNWTWDPPRQPMPYTQRKLRKVNPLYIRIKAAIPFRGHKFRLGRSKK